MRALPFVALAAGAALALAGCSPSGPAADGRIRVVASTNVYGDIAKTIGGDRVSVTSIISDPSQDPHSYEADAQVQLALSQADLVIENGGGYDAFVDTLLKGAGDSKTIVLDAVDISGYDQRPATGEFNEHVWYDFPTVQKVVARIQKALATQDPSGADAFAANAKTFDAGLTSLESGEAAIKATSAGVGAAITEPVPLYLLNACGLVDKTPQKFSAAMEAGTDVSPLVLRETLGLFTSGAVKLLAYNEQRSGPQTDQVVAAAKAAGVAVIPVTETLPAGKHYLGWMTGTLAAVKAAVAG